MNVSFAHVNFMNNFDRGWVYGNFIQISIEMRLESCKECILDENKKDAVPVFLLRNLESIDDIKINLNVKFNRFLSEMIIFRVFEHTTSTPVILPVSL